MNHKCQITPEWITDLKNNEIFVFGSNLAGEHNGGAARMALNWGAQYGNPEGIQGSTYALPTVDENINPLSTAALVAKIGRLRTAIQENPDKHFLITKVGCGIAGLTVDDVAPLFIVFTDIANCSLPTEFINQIFNF